MVREVIYNVNKLKLGNLILIKYLGFFIDIGVVISIKEVDCVNEAIIISLENGIYKFNEINDIVDHYNLYLFKIDSNHKYYREKISSHRKVKDTMIKMYSDIWSSNLIESSLMDNVMYILNKTII